MAFNHNFWVGARWHRTPQNHWDKHSASLEAEKIHTAANNFKEDTSYQKTPFLCLVSAKRDVFFPLLSSLYPKPFFNWETTTLLECAGELQACDQHQPCCCLGQVSWACRQGILGLGAAPSHPSSSQLQLCPKHLAVLLLFSQGIWKQEGKGGSKLHEEPCGWWF